MKNEYPKLMEVSNNLNFPKDFTYEATVLIQAPNGLFIAESLNDSSICHGYKYARDINPYRELGEACKNGGIIQIKSKTNHLNDMWFDYYIENICEYTFNDDLDYRIKPTPEYIPFDFFDADKLIGKAVKSKEYDFIAIITAIYIDNVVTIADYQYSIENLFSSFVFLDGSPCGKLKNE